MKVRHLIVASALLIFAVGSVYGARLDRSSKRFLLDKEGGTIEIQASDGGDKETRDAVRRQLKEQARKGVPSVTPAMQEHKKEIKYRYEKTSRGGRLRIIAKGREALLAVQEFVRSEMSNSTQRRSVAFDFVVDTPLVVVPVTINNHGPYKFLLDTGASNTVLSAAVADALGIPMGRTEVMFSAAGNLRVNLRTLKTLQAGAALLEDVRIAVADFPLMKSLNVDGILGGDYLSRFKVSIDYDNQIVDIEPFAPEEMSMVVA
jgi:hypothetical protein